jgi:antitoxin component YwqK of YwqJK toxin-antitoxin module
MVNKRGYSSIVTDYMGRLSESWYDNEQLSEQLTYVNGKVHGLCKSWHENGQLHKIANYDDNSKLTGLYQTWYEDGKLCE